MASRRFGFIGSPLPCLNACAAQGSGNVYASPNYNAEADGMVSIIAHESMEIATDPLINAWCGCAMQPRSTRSQCMVCILRLEFQES
jgi:hypothetical protein